MVFKTSNKPSLRYIIGTVPLDAYWWSYQSFNDQCATNYYLLELIVIDGTISPCYGMGGDCINSGLPHYIVINQSFEDGCEIQDAADGRNGIMIRLKLS